jgi:Arc/MetJ-type ribon-helix-helix transcriptional regulator
MVVNILQTCRVKQLFGRLHLTKLLQKPYNNHMSITTINISLPTELVKEIDRDYKAEYGTRSDFIRQTITDRVRRNRASKRAEATEAQKDIDFKVLKAYSLDLKAMGISDEEADDYAYKLRHAK